MNIIITVAMGENMETVSLETGIRLLRAVVALMLQSAEDRPKTLRQKVQILSELGIGQTEIAKILCRTDSYVSKELVSIRKSKKKRSV